MLYTPLIVLFRKIAKGRKIFKKIIVRMVSMVIFFLSVWIIKIGIIRLFPYIGIGDPMSLFPIVKQKPSCLIDIGDWFLPETVEFYPSFLYIFIFFIAYFIIICLFLVKDVDD